MNNDDEEKNLTSQAPLKAHEIKDFLTGLTESEIIASWTAVWECSLEGKAIVKKDFTFHRVNPRFCEILGVSPAKIMEGTFGDITPKKVREEDIQNARLVSEGRQQSYKILKHYEFENSRSVEVELLVVGIFGKSTNKFLFYVSSIVPSTPPPKKQATLFELIDKNKKKITIASAFLASIVALWDTIKAPFTWLIKAIANEL